MSRLNYNKYIYYGRDLVQSRLRAAVKAYDLNGMLENSSPKTIIYAYAVGFDNVADNLLKGRARNFNSAADPVVSMAQVWERDVLEAFLQYKQLLLDSRPSFTIQDVNMIYSIATDLTFSSFLKEFLFQFVGGLFKTHRDAPKIAAYVASLSKLDEYMDYQIYGPLYSAYVSDLSEVR